MVSWFNLVTTKADFASSRPTEWAFFVVVQKLACKSAQRVYVRTIQRELTREDSSQDKTHRSGEGGGVPAM